MKKKSMRKVIVLSAVLVGIIVMFISFNIGKSNGTSHAK